MKDCVDIVISGPIGIGKLMIIDHICKWAGKNGFYTQYSDSAGIDFTCKSTDAFKKQAIQHHGKTVFIQEKQSKE